VASGIGPRAIDKKSGIAGVAKIGRQAKISRARNAKSQSQLLRRLENCKPQGRAVFSQGRAIWGTYGEL
jgi:hypothetical protein